MRVWFYTHVDPRLCTGRGGRGSPVLAFEGVHVAAHPAAGVKAASDRCVMLLFPDTSSQRMLLGDNVEMQPFITCPCGFLSAVDTL